MHYDRARLHWVPRLHARIDRPADVAGLYEPAAVARALHAVLQQLRGQDQPVFSGSVRSAARPVALRKENAVCTTTVPSSTAPRAPQRASLPQTMESDFARGASSAMSTDATAGYDGVLMVAALEEIAARRAAIEWLLDADLLCLCLV